MDTGHGKMMRVNVESDRLSSLPDDLIHKILSFVDITDAIGTSVLSSRWRPLWTSMPYLNVSSEDFPTLPKFSKFVTNVLSRRNNLAEVYSLNLTFRVKTSLQFVKRVLNYAFSHNIQQLNVVCLLEKDIEFPLSLFSSRSLKHLTFTMQPSRSHYKSYFTSTWELPTLTTLNLDSVTLPDGISVLSKCSNLKNLTLNHFKTTESDGFSICHPRLSNLTLGSCSYRVKAINVDAPQLENLNIRYCDVKFVITAPDLAFLFYKDNYEPLRLSTEGFHSLEKADICVFSPRDVHAHQIICMLQQLHSVEYLTLNIEIVEILSSSVDLIIPQPSPFVNLKSLKIYPENSGYWCGQPHKKVTIMSTKLKSYLLDSSPGCTFTMVFREEIQAQNLMAELRVFLEKEGDREREKTRVESHEPNKLETKGVMQLKSSWKNLCVQIEQRKDKACLIISELERIKELLTELPASNRAKIQPCFSRLCADADIAISKITNCMKIKCDENQSHSSLCINDFAILEPSS